MIQYLPKYRDKYTVLSTIFNANVLFVIEQILKFQYSNSGSPIELTHMFHSMHTNLRHWFFPPPQGQLHSDLTPARTN